MPTCSSFTTILSEKELIELAASWNPLKNGFTCLCISNRDIVTTDLLKHYNMKEDLCESIMTESRALMFLKIIESVSLATVSIVFDFFFECKLNVTKYSKIWVFSNVTPITMINYLQEW